MSYATLAGRAGNRSRLASICTLHRLLQQCLAITTYALNRVLVTVNCLWGHRPCSLVPTWWCQLPGANVVHPAYVHSCTCQWSFIRYSPTIGTGANLSIFVLQLCNYYTVYSFGQQPFLFRISFFHCQSILVFIRVLQKSFSFSLLK
jgi:hypothetical protein